MYTLYHAVQSAKRNVEILHHKWHIFATPALLLRNKKDINNYSAHNIEKHYTQYRQQTTHPTDIEGER